MSEPYREPPAGDLGPGERLWSRSSRSSILAVVFGAATAGLGVWLYVNDPRHTAPVVGLLGGFAAFVLFAWVITSRAAVVAMFDRGLRVGWLGFSTRFVPWDEVTRVEEELRRTVNRYGLSLYDYSEIVHVHCGGAVYSIRNRAVGGKSFLAAKRVLRAHVPAERFVAKRP